MLITSETVQKVLRMNEEWLNKGMTEEILPLESYITMCQNLSEEDRLSLLDEAKRGKLKPFLGPCGGPEVIKSRMSTSTIDGTVITYENVFKYDVLSGHEYTSGNMEQENIWRAMVEYGKLTHMSPYSLKAKYNDGIAARIIAGDAINGEFLFESKCSYEDIKKILGEVSIGKPVRVSLYPEEPMGPGNAQTCS